jgi:hypothetical protein
MKTGVKGRKAGARGQGPGASENRLSRASGALVRGSHERQQRGACVRLPATGPWPLAPIFGCLRPPAPK